MVYRELFNNIYWGLLRVKAKRFPEVSRGFQSYKYNEVYQKFLYSLQRFTEGFRVFLKRGLQRFTESCLIGFREVYRGLQSVGY